MSTLSDVHLAVFLSRATSLRHWDECGIFDREAAFYLRLRAHVASLRIVTCGGEEDLAYRERLRPLDILHNRWAVPPNLYSVLSPFLHRTRLGEVTVCRSHQLDGAWSAAVASRLLATPLIVRGGYLWAEFFERNRGRGAKAWLARRLQAFALGQAQAVSLATDDMKRHVVHQYGRPAASIHVIPNYVDSTAFCPRPEIEPIPGRICYVGRLHPSKNVRALLEALARIPGASLAVAGDGAERASLAAFARRQRLDVTFHGTLPHERLPGELARSQVFVLPSAFEGQPKALIEAMACGAAVVGTDVDGTRSAIRHEDTGLLCPATVEGLTGAIQRLLDDGDLRRRLGHAARAFVQRTFSLDLVVERELELLGAVTKQETAAWRAATF